MLLIIDTRSSCNTLTITFCNSTEVMIANSPDFVKELLPSAQRTALLYHLSYLCLANFPKLERELRERAVETQLLFGSSEALLLKVRLMLPFVHHYTGQLSAEFVYRQGNAMLFKRNL